MQEILQLNKAFLDVLCVLRPILASDVHNVDILLRERFLTTAFRHTSVLYSSPLSGSSLRVGLDSKRVEHNATTRGNEATADADDPQSDRQTGERCGEADQRRPGKKATISRRRHGSERCSCLHTGNSAGGPEQDGDNIGNS